MSKPRKKLTDEQIVKLEQWAKEKKQIGCTTKEEKSAVDQIKKFSAQNWKGIRAEAATVTEIGDAKWQLERLKRKEV